MKKIILVFLILFFNINAKDCCEKEVFVGLVPEAQGYQDE